MQKDITKKYKIKKHIFNCLSIFCTLLPLLIYTIIGFVNGEITQKVTLGLSLFMALIFVAINIIFKKRIRSTIFILMLGIYTCIQKITPLLLILSITTILDEFVFTPLAKKYKNLYTINKEIDKRGW